MNPGSGHASIAAVEPGPGPSPGPMARGLTRSLLTFGLAGVLLWAAIVCCGQVPGLRDDEQLQVRLFTPMLAGNLALACLAISVELRSDGWLPRLMVWAWAVLAGFLGSAAALLTLGLWGRDMGLISIFFIPAALGVVVPFLRGAEVLLPSVLHRAGLLASSVVVATAIIQLGAEAAAAQRRLHFECLLVAGSAVAGLSIFTWLAVWGAASGRRSA
jgi:hypothetical protein